MKGLSQDGLESKKGDEADSQLTTAQISPLCVELQQKEAQSSRLKLGCDYCRKPRQTP